MFRIILTILKFENVKKDFFKILQSSWFNSLAGDSQKLQLIHLQKSFDFSGQNELAKLCHPEQYNSAIKELNKNELINRIELKQILKHCNSKMRTLLMVLYEGALRKGELLNIKYKHIKFEDEYINLFIDKSKTRERNS